MRLSPDLLLQFNLETEALFEKIEAALDVSPFSLPAAELHTLKGLCLTVSRPELADIVHQMEEERERDTLLDCLEALKRNLQTSTSLDFFEFCYQTVKNASAQSNKSVILSIQGMNTNVETSLLETLRVPVMHLLMNAVDHGIDESGSVELKLEKSSVEFIVTVSDSGRGINHAKLALKAQERGLNTVDDELCFIPGLSSLDEASLTSGRGMGLSVVKDSLKKLHGRVEVKSSAKGSSFRLFLPLKHALKKTA